MAMTNEERIQSIANDARESFDLGDFLRGRSVRTRNVRVFTDEVTAEKRGGFEKTVETLANGIQLPGVRSWGLVKDLAEAQDQYDKLESKNTKVAKELKARIDSINDEIRALTATLIETSLEIELKTVPKVIKKDAYRAARKALGIHGSISDDQAVEFIDEHNAQTLSRTVVSIARPDGSKNQGISLDSARDLVGLLPDSEWEKIKVALDELLSEKVIGDAAVADQDF